MTADGILKALEAERVRHGLTMEELAADANGSSSAYSRWMRGEMKPNLVTLIPYCDALGLELTLKRRDDE